MHLEKINLDKENIELINAGKICPYCYKETKYVDSYFVHGTSHNGMIYYCHDCKAWVGVHQGTDKALGRLANAYLRALKINAHHYFDQIAKTSLINQLKQEFIPNISNRNKAYLWLSEQLNISVEQCHIGLFDNELCQQTIDICMNALRISDNELISNTKKIDANTKNISNIEASKSTVMNQTNEVFESFKITLNGNEYECKPIEEGNTMLYLIQFNKSYLCITQGTGRNGEVFWTSVPEDYKLKHLVLELGQQIEKHYL